MSTGRRMRVLLVSGSAPPMECGIGYYTACLARQLATLDGFDVGLVTSRHPGRVACDGQFAGVELLTPFPRWSLLAFGKARAALLRWRPDVLHVQCPAQGYDGPLAAPLSQWFRRWQGKPVVVTLHEHIRPYQLAFLALAQSADAIVSVRHNFQDGYRKGLSRTAARKPFHYIPNASSVPAVTPTPGRVRATRSKWGVAAGKAMIAYFGLLYPGRGVDQLFQIAHPERHHLVIVGGKLNRAEDYHRQVAALATSGAWQGSCSLAGFLPDEEAAAVLACSDAVVLPFLEGGGTWNTSLQAARLQGTFAVTTSRTERGLDPRRNVYFARPGDIEEMRAALGRHLGRRSEGSANDLPTWPGIAAQHKTLYESLTG